MAAKICSARAVYINFDNVFADCVRVLFSRISEHCRELF